MEATDDQLLKRIWEYMDVQTPLAHADAIVVGGCADGNVAVCAAELYTLGFAPIVVFSGYQQPGMDTTEADFLADIARDHGVPESAILREPIARNTGENIRLSETLLNQHGISPKTVILVHMPYTSRRFLATAQVQWSDPKPRFIARHEEVSYVEYSLRHGRGETIRKMLGDFNRMKSYAKKGYQASHPIPAEIQEAFDTLVWRGHKAH